MISFAVLSFFVSFSVFFRGDCKTEDDHGARDLFLFLLFFVHIVFQLHFVLLDFIDRSGDAHRLTGSVDGQ